MKKQLTIAALLLLVNVGTPLAALDTRDLPESVKQRIAAAGGEQPPVKKLEYLAPDAVSLTEKEMQALELSKDFAKSGPKPFMQGGKLVYVHGNGRPTVIAAPMQVSDVELESGEKVNEIVVGDSARWLVADGISGNVTHLFVKPLDSGLESSAVVTTDRRVYHFRLLSRQADFTPYVGFVYQEDIRTELRTQAEKTEKNRKWQSTEEVGGKTADMAQLNFDYIVTGAASWKPERVYDDGRKTYIQLPASVTTGEMPVLLVRKGGQDVLVNYRVKNLRVMEVDGMFDVIALVVGVDGGVFGRNEQELVEIERVAKNSSSNKYNSDQSKVSSLRPAER